MWRSLSSAMPKKTPISDKLYCFSDYLLTRAYSLKQPALKLRPLFQIPGAVVNKSFNYIQYLIILSLWGAFRDNETNLLKTKLIFQIQHNKTIKNPH